VGGGKGVVFVMVVVEALVCPVKLANVLQNNPSGPSNSSVFLASFASYDNICFYIDFNN